MNKNELRRASRRAKQIRAQGKCVDCKSNHCHCEPVDMGDNDCFCPTISCVENDEGFQITIVSQDESGEINTFVKTLKNGINGQSGQDAPESLVDLECEQQASGNILITFTDKNGNTRQKLLTAGDKGEPGDDGQDSLANIQCETTDATISFTITDKDGIETVKDFTPPAGADSKADIQCTDTHDGVVFAVTDKDGNTQQKTILNGAPGEDGEDGIDGEDSLADIDCKDIEGGVEFTVTDAGGQTKQKIIRDGEKGEDGQDSLANIECEDFVGGIKLTITDKDGVETCKDVLDGKPGEDAVCLANIECEELAGGDVQFTVTDKDGNETRKTVRQGQDGQTPAISCQQLPDGSVSIAVNGGTPKILLAGAPGEDGEDGDDGVSPTIDCTEGDGFVTFCIVNADGSKTLKTLTAPSGTGTGGPAVNSVNVNTDLSSDCVLGIDVSVNGIVSSDEVSLEGLLDKVEFPQQPNTSLCFSFDDSEVYTPDQSGKITADLDFKVRNWNSNTFKHVPYDSTGQCFDIPYCGPVKTDIQECIVEALAGIDFGDGVSPRTDSEIKAIAQACIDLLPTALPYCLTGAGVSVNGSTVTVTLSQENCDPTVFSFEVGAGGTVECCNTGLTVNQNGDDYEIVLNQSNGPNFTAPFTINHPAQDSYCLNRFSLSAQNNVLSYSIDQENCAILNGSLTLPTYCVTGINQTQEGQIVTLEFIQENCPTNQSVSFTVGGDGNGTVECCNTAFLLNAAVNQDNKTIDFTGTINQSAGANYTDTASVPIEDIADQIFDIELRNDPNGCDQFQQITLCGTDFGMPIPLYSPREYCTKLCLVGVSGAQSITLPISAGSYTVAGATHDDDGTLIGDIDLSGTGTIDLAFGNEPVNASITICTDNPCVELDPFQWSHTLQNYIQPCGC